jgi:hypothetical protein
VFGPLLLYLLPLPLFPAIFIALARGNFVNFTVSLAAFVLLLAAAWSTRRGMKRDLEIVRLGWSRIRAIPWKLLGALGTGLATSLCSLFIVGNALPASVAIGATAAVGVTLSYDLDGLLYRWARRDPLISRDREVTQALQEARVRIDRIDQANRQIKNPELKRRIRHITRQAVGILTTIADDPATLRQSRRFLKVYLEGARQVTEKYASVHPDYHQGKLEDNFRNVLITIEETFEEQQRKMQQKDLLDLDIQIEVLATQLKNEGVI